MTQHDCTRKIEQFRFYKTDDEVCKMAGISKPTLYTRLKKSNWKTKRDICNRKAKAMKKQPTLKDAVSRIRFTISKQNKPNQSDADAFNSICEHLQAVEEKTTKENLLFAKLFAFVLAEFLNHYTDIDFANKQLNKILAEPMDTRLGFLLLKLKEMEYRNYFHQKNVLDPFLKTKTVSELESIHKIHKDRIPELNALDFVRCGNNWDYNSVVYQLESQINLSIQNFKNNV